MTRIRYTVQSSERHPLGPMTRALSGSSGRKCHQVCVFILGAFIGLTIATLQQELTKLSRNTNQQNVSSNATHITVILVLGEMLVHGANASENLKSRIHAAQDVADEERSYDDGTVSHSNDIIHVILSGGDTAQVNHTESRVMKELWGERNPKEIIHLENQSLSTCQNAYYSIPILEQIRRQHWPKHLHTRPQHLHIILVTSDYHVARAELLFEQVFQTVIQQQNHSIIRKFDMEFTLHIDDVVGAPTMDTELRQQLFRNERRWLKPKKIDQLLHQMNDHPFQSPSKERIRRALVELNRWEKYEELN